VSEALSPAVIEALRQLDSCAIANAIETFAVRLRNEGFTDAGIRCVFPTRPPVVGYAVTATIRCSTPPAVGHVYADRTDWWNDILKTPAPRIVVVQDVDDHPGTGAFVGEVHAHILRALGCVACVTNGAVRDLPAVRAAGLQLFAASTSPSHAFVHIVSFGEPVAVALRHRAVVGGLFEVIHNLDRLPVRDVTILTAAKDAVQHPRCAQQSDMAAMQRRERPSRNHRPLAKQQPVGLTVGAGLLKQLFNVIQWESFIDQSHWGAFGQGVLEAGFWQLRWKRVGLVRQAGQKLS